MSAPTTTAPPPGKPGSKRTAESKRKQSQGMKRRWAEKKIAEKAHAELKDPPPDPKRKSGKQRPTTKQLEDLLAEMLVLPAIPAKLVWDCDYCMNHFLAEGPKTAVQLAVLAEQNEPLRRALERLYGWWTTITLTGALGMYVAKPLAHHYAPPDAYQAVAPVFGMPPQPMHNHPHHHDPHAERPTYPEGAPQTDGAATAASTGSPAPEPEPAAGD